MSEPVRQRPRGGSGWRLCAAALLLAVVAVRPVSAGAEETPVPPTGQTATVYIRIVHGLPSFVAPPTVAYGEELRIVNQTNSKLFGPYTFSLVEPSLVPRSAAARRLCGAKGHICRAIEAWHGAEGNGRPTVGLVQAGPPGWSTAGNARGKTGDSWFTGTRPEASFEQQVTAEAGTTLYFICAIHPWMHGSILVVPPPAPPVPPAPPA